PGSDLWRGSKMAPSRWKQPWALLTFESNSPAGDGECSRMFVVTEQFWLPRNAANAVGLHARVYAGAREGVSAFATSVDLPRLCIDKLGPQMPACRTAFSFLL